MGRLGRIILVRFEGLHVFFYIEIARFRFSNPKIPSLLERRKV